MSPSPAARMASPKVRQRSSGPTRKGGTAIGASAGIAAPAAQGHSTSAPARRRRSGMSRSNKKSDCFERQTHFLCLSLATSLPNVDSGPPAGLLFPILDPGHASELRDRFRSGGPGWATLVTTGGRERSAGRHA